MPDPLQTVLDAAPIPTEAKANVWDAYHAAQNQDEFKAAFDKIVLPTQLKAQLWDLKFSSATPPPPQTDVFGQIQKLAAANVGNAALGFAKAAGRTAVNLGRAVHQIPGVDAVFGKIPEDASA